MGGGLAELVSWLELSKIGVEVASGDVEGDLLSCGLITARYAIDPAKAEAMVIVISTKAMIVLFMLLTVSYE